MNTEEKNNIYNGFIRLNKNAVEDLIEFCVCPICCLRFCDADNINLYCSSEGRIKQALSERLGCSFKDAPSDTHICVACLDILRDRPHKLSLLKEKSEEGTPKRLKLDIPEDNQNENQQKEEEGNFDKWVIETVLQSKHDMDSFSVDITIPTAVFIRNYSLYAYLNREYHIGNNINMNMRPLKEIYKYKVIHAIQMYNDHWKYNQDDILRLTFKYSHSETEEEYHMLPGFEHVVPKKRDGQQVDGITTVTNTLSNLSIDAFPSQIECPPHICDTLPVPSFSPIRKSVYVTGNYRKYQRGLSQTPWVLEGERRTEGSVEEYICTLIQQAYDCDSYKFHSAGREDIDVRMIGTGRPFVCEIINGKHNQLTKEQYHDLEIAINKSTQAIQIDNLRLCSPEGFENMKEAAEEKQKTYVCVVYTDKEISPAELESLTQYKDMTIYQNTPIRVLHRRTLMVREKTIHSLTPKYINPHHFLCTISASAGTYIKEFIHGDLGRTRPNMGELLHCDADILQLDVTGVVDTHPIYISHQTTCIRCISLSFDPYSHSSFSYISSYDTENLRKARQQVERFSKLEQFNVKLSDLEKVGDPVTPEKFLQYCQFLYHELPIRMAYRIVDLENMPYGLYDISFTQTVRNWYLFSFIDILTNPRPVTTTQALQFAQVLESIYERHSATLVMMSKGILTLKKQLETQYHTKDREFSEINKLGPLLDEFYLSRIGIRTLLEHEQALHKQLHSPERGYMGIICQMTSPQDVSKLAIEHANFVCSNQYGITVPVYINGCVDRTFSYIPSHLRHMLFELLKNSMRATIETHKDKEEKHLPPIHIIIADGEQNNDVVIKISDQGGGIKRAKINNIWNYFYTSDSGNKYELLSDGADFGIDSPMYGLGYGLPLSRLYAKYFGGDLQIVSMEGYGTDAYLHLKRVGGEEVIASPMIRR
ncbi:hypothetical protein WA158_000369 [Blastocystis sp. Blastoise]